MDSVSLCVFVGSATRGQRISLCRAVGFALTEATFSSMTHVSSYIYLAYGSNAVVPHV